MSALAESEFVEPAYVWQPPRHHSLLPKVEKICQLLGETLEPEQSYAIDVLTGRKSDGSPATLSAAAICARQNLKTFILERIILTIFLDPRSNVELIVWTSQRLQACDQTFVRFKRWFTAKNRDGSFKHPYFAERLDPDATGGGVNSGKGEKAIVVKIGDESRTLLFNARSEKSGQALTADVVVFDEAFALDDEHAGSLIPTLATRRMAMIFYGSSACHADSDRLRDIVEQGRTGGKGAPAYIEFCAPGSFQKPGCEQRDCRHTRGTAGCVADRRDYLRMANPMVDRIRSDGNGINWQFLADERRDLSPLQYMRERLGWHEPPESAVAAPVTVELWKSGDDTDEDPDIGIADGVSHVFAPEIATDRKSASIAVAGYRSDDEPHVELIENDSGTSWLLPRLRQLAATWKLHEIDRGTGKVKKECVGIIIDPSSPAGTLIDDLRADWVDEDGEEQPGFEPVVMTARDAATAAGDLYDGLMQETVHHPVQSEVESALKGAIRRDLGDGGWTFGRAKSAKELIDITPAVACTNALWGLTLVEPELDDSVAGAY